MSRKSWKASCSQNNSCSLILLGMQPIESRTAHCLQGTDKTHITNISIPEHWEFLLLQYFNKIRWRFVNEKQEPEVVTGKYKREKVWNIRVCLCIRCHAYDTPFGNGQVVWGGSSYASKNQIWKTSKSTAKSDAEEHHLARPRLAMFLQ